MSYEGQLRAILNSCDNDQLEKYLNEPDAVDTLIQSMDSYNNITSEKTMLAQENQSLAETNLHKEPLLEELKMKLRQAIDEFQEAKQEYVSVRETYEAQKAAGDDLSLPAILSQLQMSASRSEEDTDKLADDFFCASTSTHTDEELNLFQRQFLEQRTQAHIIKIKAEKMKEQLPA